jgi:segregation and condensation protein A
MIFSVDLDIFRGPLDLLLYLVRKHEVEITDIPIATITDQFLVHLEVLEKIDVNKVGDFLEMASTLVEIKSRIVLPNSDEEQGELEDPRKDLVRQLLEYKKFRDAASLLEEQSRDWQKRFSRQSVDLPPRVRDYATEPIREVELWDLVSAFSRILRDSEAQKPSSIIYDETPIHVYMKQIHQLLQRSGRLALSEIFQPGMQKSKMIGIFLAVLELIRHYGIQCDQDELFGEMWLLPSKDMNQNLDLTKVDTYEHTKPDTSSDQ